MSNLEDIIKQKVNQFDVPYNEAHWEAVEAKLNKLKIAKLKKNAFIAAGIVTILSIGSIFIYQQTKPSQQVTIEEKHTLSTNTNINNTTNNNNKEAKQPLTNNKTTSTNNNSNKNTTNNSTHIQSINNKTTVEVNEPQTTTPTPNKEVIPTIINAEFIVYNNRICLGEEVSFEAIERKNLSYLWSFGDGQTSSLPSPTHSYLTEGEYTVKLQVIDNTTGQTLTNEVQNAVKILPLPNVEYSYFEEATKNDGNKLKYPFTIFKAKDKNLDSYTWNFSNGQTSSQPISKVIFDKKGNFKTTLTARNNHGCVNSSTKIISVDYPFNLYAPNAFSPNNDGDNDIFIPKALLAWDVQFEMLIKNKVGDVVFKSSDKYNGWNGKHNNSGATLDQGIYFWQVITYDSEGTPHQHFGKLTLIK